MEKASIFNCPKNCGLEFHCVLNANRTSLIALCAPVRIIIGEVCPEYNNHGDRVQRNKFARCSSCPYMFKSNETFKYNECITIKPRDIMAYTTLMQPQRTQKSNPVYSISPKTTAATTSGFLPSHSSKGVLASLPSTAVFLNFFCERIYIAILR
nr:uncharacterized protein LOC117691028 [Crassostrea gigas]